MTDELKVTSAAEYRNRIDNRDGDLVSLPSGAVFRVQLPNNFWFLSKGDILPVAVYGEDNQVSEVPKGQSLRQSVAIQFALITERVIEPKIRRPADKNKGELDPSELAPEDATFLMDLLNGRIDKTGRSLRAGNGVDVAPDAGEDSQILRKVAERPS